MFTQHASVKSLEYHLSLFLITYRTIKVPCLSKDLVPGPVVGSTFALMHVVTALKHQRDSQVYEAYF